MSAIKVSAQPLLLQQLSPPEWRQLLDLLECFESLPEGADRVAWVARLTKERPLHSALLEHFGAVHCRSQAAAFLCQPAMSVASMRQCVDVMARLSRGDV